MIRLSNHLSCCHTGTFLIATDDNRSCRMAINAGRVTHCSFGREHGDDALKTLHTVTKGHCSFVKHLNFPFKERSQINDKHAVETLIAVLNDQATQASEQPSKQRLPSGLTDVQMEALFGKFHFE
ncbi:hypothetical protein EOL70_14925 [Leucothrix sargassi]|nr:hypothetical protein EOL70_14925 [Leucothrix sargassi]